MLATSVTPTSGRVSSARSPFAVQDARPHAPSLVHACAGLTRQVIRVKAALTDTPAPTARPSPVLTAVAAATVVGPTPVPVHPTNITMPVAPYLNAMIIAITFEYGTLGTLQYRLADA